MAKAVTEQNKTTRLDLALVARGLMESRAQAQAAIKAGCVKIDGVTSRKASTQIAEHQILEAEKAHPYVSRGGLKLAKGLAAFGVAPQGLVCLDIGASTGGFTDVLLRAGAEHVYAVDVGRDQLHPSLRNDPRVANLEATDARSLTADQLHAAPDLLVCDASFIMLEKVLEVPLSLLADVAVGVVLFKPQFQVGPDNVGRGGVVVNQPAVERAWRAFVEWLKSQGWDCKSRVDSPIRGGDGNQEYLALLERL